LTQDELEALYRSSKDRYQATAQLPEQSAAEIEANLRRVANEAEDVHLRVNASLMLGHMFEDRGDSRAAISFYRQAAALLPDSVDPHIVLALGLAQAERWDEAIAEQWLVVEQIPDDLVGWLLLGELHVKAGKLEEATQVYGAYELRRKGLLDGLTLKHDGEYLKAEAERVACAEALAPAVDNGTALALLYAFDSDPSPRVRAAIASVMGEQRLLGYSKLLTSKLTTESDAEVKEAITWALAEIEREGVETNPGPVPEAIAAEVEAEAKALAEGKTEEPGPPAAADPTPTKGDPAPAEGEPQASKDAPAQAPAG
jgi:tetratricopeptide (TPR) repeat protein